MEIAVYVLTDDASSTRVEIVKSLFSDPLFTTHVITIQPPIGATATSSMTLDDVVEGYRFAFCLDNAKKTYPNSYVAIIKDNSVSNVAPNTMAEIISSAVKAGPWDLFYLCKWQDRCDLYTDKKSIINKSTLIATTQSPNGTQAIVFSPDGRDIILGHKQGRNGVNFSPINQPLSNQLNKHIFEGNLKATCTSPNLLDFDITTATNNQDYMKSQECADPPPPAPFVTNNSFILLWLLIAIIVIILVIFALYKVRPR